MNIWNAVAIRIISGVKWQKCVPASQVTAIQAFSASAECQSSQATVLLELCVLSEAVVYLILHCKCIGWKWSEMKHHVA